MGAPGQETADSPATGCKAWTAVVKAENDPDRETCQELQPYLSQLQHVFGYTSYRLLGEDAGELSIGKTVRLTPTRHYQFNLTLQSMEASDGPYHLDLELHKEERLLVESEVKLASGSPLFIRGPQWGSGQLIFLVRAERKE